ncbi:MAG: T9SS type A sorting domain-containing protein [Bacteroidota bacterium]|nr:T9SS type A sorting domain-containing protein [Bacteroidota bacterium]
MKLKNIITLIVLIFIAFESQPQDYYYGNGIDGSPTFASELKTDGTRGIADVIDNNNKEITFINLTGSFSVNDRVLIVQMEGPDAGNYEVNKVSQNNGSSLVFTGIFLNNYIVADIVQVIRIPQYSNLTINGTKTVTCEPYNSVTGGGIVCFFVNNTLTFSDDGKVKANGKGYYGGDGGTIGPNVNTGDLGKGGLVLSDKNKRNGKDAEDYNHGHRNVSWVINYLYSNNEGGNGGAGGFKIGIAGQEGTDGASTAVLPNQFSKLLLGNGGNGGDSGDSGGAGGHGGGGGAGGYNGTDGTLGENGYSGGNGGNGGAGGGAIYIRANNVDLRNGAAVLLSNGKNGNDGQDGNGSGIGGKGGDGGNGGDGICGIYGPGAPGTPGFNGDGAGGGNGGKGGDAGMILFEYGNQQLNLSIELRGGTGGSGGIGAEPNPSTGSTGTWGTLDLDVSGCTWSYLPIITESEFICRCEDAFRHLSYCEISQYYPNDNEWAFWNLNGDILCTYNENDKELKCDVITTIDGNSTRPTETHTDIYKCELDDGGAGSGCNNCFLAIGNGTLPGNNTADYTYFDNNEYIYTKSTGYLTNNFNTCWSKCLDWRSCLYASCPQSGSDGSKGNDGDGNNNFFSRYHENSLTYRSNSTGIIETEFDYTNFKIYPNPTNNKFFVKFVAEIKKEYIFEIYSTKGEKIQTKQYISNGELTKLNFNIQSLEKGVYFLLIKSEGKSTSVKITKL